MRPLGVAIAGTGFGARVILPAFKSDPQARVVALLGGDDRSRTRALAETAGVPVWDASFKAVCAREDVDVVAIATPHELHEAMVHEALAAGKHIICEKPLALTLAATEDIVKRGAASPGLCLVDLQLRFHPAIDAIGRALRAGRIGRPYEARLMFSTDRYVFPRRPASRWWFDPSRGGGMLTATGPHLLDLVSDWFGLDLEWLNCGFDRVLECVENGGGGSLHVEAESAFSCIMKIRNGPRVWLSATAAAYTPTQLEAVILGTGGELRLRAPDIVELRTALNAKPTQETLHQGTGESLFAEGFRRFERELVDALMAREPERLAGAATFERYAVEQQVIESMRRSAEGDQR